MTSYTKQIENQYYYFRKTVEENKKHNKQLLEICKKIDEKTLPKNELILLSLKHLFEKNKGYKIYRKRILEIFKEINEKTLLENKLMLSFKTFIEKNKLDFYIPFNTIIKTKNLYLVELCFNNGIKWKINKFICHGSIDFLKQAINVGYEWNNEVGDVYYINNLQSLRKFKEEVAVIKLLKYANVDYTNALFGMFNYISSINLIICFGTIDMLKFALDNGCKWNNYSIRYIINSMSIDMLQFAINNGCKWNKYSVYDIITTNNIDMLKFAINNGCEWSDEKSLLWTNYDELLDELNSGYSRDIEGNIIISDRNNGYSDKDNDYDIIYNLYNIKNSYYNFIFYLIISNSNLEMLKYIIKNNNKIKIDLQKIVVLSIKLKKDKITEWLEKKFNESKDESKDENRWRPTEDEKKYDSSFYDIARKFLCMRCVKEGDICDDCAIVDESSDSSPQYSCDSCDSFGSFHESNRQHAGDDEHRRAMD